MTSGSTFTPTATADVTVLALGCDSSTVRRMAAGQTVYGRDLPLGVDALVQPRLTMDEVEALFNRLVAVSQGRPVSREKLPTDKHFVAAMLILREFMHHLHFAEVSLPSALHNVQN